MSNRKKNLIIGAIVNYAWEEISLFFDSIKNIKFENCDIVLLVSKINEETINKIKSFGVLVYQIDEKYLKGPIIHTRWEIIMDYLYKNYYKYKYVFTLDIRDAYFQDDPFKYYNLTKSYLGISINDGILDENPYKDWIINDYGIEKQKLIKNKRTFYADTVWGTIDKIYAFSKIMTENLGADSSKNLKAESIGNYIIYYNKVFKDCLIKSDNNDGYVLTLSSESHDPNIIIYNKQGKKAAVIHLYDKHKEITESYYNSYASIKIFITFL